MSICENSCAFHDPNNKYDVLLDQLRREIRELSKTTDAQLLMMDKKIAATCVYIQNNLSNTLRELLDTMLSSGELEEIITSVLLDDLHDLKTKFDDIINVKLFGAVGDGVTDDTNALQDAIDYAKLHNKIIFLPSGTYVTKRALFLYEWQTITGNSRKNTTIKRIGTMNERERNYSAAIIFERSSDYVFEYTEGQSVKNLSITCDQGVTYGIYAPTGCPYAEIDNVNINTALIGIYYKSGSWLARITNVSIWKCATGIKYGASGTSTKFENIYVMNSTEIAYDIEGLTYSEFTNVCADWCEGIVYRFHFCTLTINGLGCECNDAKTVLYVTNSRLAISSAYIFALEKDNAKYIIGNGSDLVLENSSIGSNGNHNPKAVFVESATAFNLELKNCDTNGIEAKSTTGAYYNITKFETGRSSYFTSLQEKLPYIGSYNNEPKKADQIGYDLPMVGIYSNILGHPYYGKGLSGNREWHSVKNRGDLFINQAPANGIAFFQQITDTAYHESEGIITAINGNVLTVSTMALGQVAERCGITITTKGKLLNESKTQVNITAVDYAANTITVSDASKFNVGEYFYFRNNVTYMRDVEYGYVQRVLIGPKTNRPAAPKGGMMYFDTNIMKPIWYTGSRWVDATGKEV